MCVLTCSRCAFPKNKYSPATSTTTKSTMNRSNSTNHLLLEGGEDEDDDEDEKNNKIKSSSVGTLISYGLDLETMLDTTKTKSPCVKLSNILDMTMKVKPMARCSSIIQPTQRQRREVRFASQAEVREYPIILGDNPSVMIGPALSMDWNYVDKRQIDIHSINVKTRTKPRIRGSAERIHILRQFGYTSKEISKATRITDFVRLQRFNSSYDTDMESETIDAYQRIRKSLTNFVTFGIKKRSQQAYFDSFTTKSLLKKTDDDGCCHCDG